MHIDEFYIKAMIPKWIKRATRNRKRREKRNPELQAMKDDALEDSMQSEDEYYERESEQNSPADDQS